jgi:hypothetical protein
MKRRIGAFVSAIALAAALAPAVSAAPIICPGDQTPTHNGGDWYCAAPSGQPTGAGWHRGTGDKL